MAKKKAAAPSAGKQAGVPAPEVPGLNSNVLKANEAVKTVAASEGEWRLNLLKENEDLARQTVDIEVDIRRLLDEQARLKTGLGKLTKEQSDLSKQVSDLSGKVNGAEKEAALGKARKDDLKADVEKLEKEIRGLTSDNDSLEKESKRLGAQAAKLDEDVKRLRKLRDEYVKTIARFKEEKEDLLA